MCLGFFDCVELEAWAIAVLPWVVVILLLRWLAGQKMTVILGLLGLTVWAFGSALAVVSVLAKYSLIDTLVVPGELVGIVDLAIQNCWLLVAVMALVTFLGAVGGLVLAKPVRPLRTGRVQYPGWTLQEEAWLSRNQLPGSVVAMNKHLHDK